MVENATDNEIIDEFTEILIDWWETWYEVCTDAFKDLTNYLIVRSVGIYTLHKLLRELIDDLLGFNLWPTRKIFKKILARMDEGTTIHFWSTSGEAGFAGGGTEKASNILSKRLMQSAKIALFSLLREGEIYAESL